MNIAWRDRPGSVSFYECVCVKHIILTLLVDIIFTAIQLMAMSHNVTILVLTHRTPALRENDKLVSGNVVFLDCLPDDFLRNAAGVQIGGIPLSKTIN